MRNFHATVGLSDDSPSTTVNFAVLVDGKSKSRASVAVGETSEIDVDVSGGFRLTIQADIPSYDVCDVTAVLIDPVLRP
jgi:hypothetical protein